MSEDEEEEDWFEKALQEPEEAAEEPVSEELSPESGDESERPFGDEDETGGPFEEEHSDGGPFGEESAESGPFADSEEGGGPFGEEGTEGGAFGGEPEGSEGGPFGGSGGSPFGEGGGEDGAFGGGEGGSLFDEDFGSAFESGGGDEFDEEEFESDIPRIDLGIEGLDNMIQGGVPQRHLMVTIGSAGTGKTTFGLQFLYHGLQKGENAVFITLEQSHESIIDTANEWGWEFDEYEAEGSLAVVDLDPVEMANSLDNIRGELPELIKDFDADRLVLDSVSLLEMMYDNPAKRRTEVFDFTRSLKEAGVTTFLTSEASESNPYASRHGTIEYLTDAVFILQYIRGEARETRLAVEIQKIRNANHSREMKPYEITSDGLSVYQQANIF